ncbi:hypothetical protein IMX26_13320 [Clostridium sp. 'deep sea']|uniref:hypothetical protein n=1 Tax=Clostridium sp. 'deep sea' TaxID=2779445 RepID=UPI0018969D62|nr:hypothetical protein [Clostridium sp. 'deep sea']QOR34461.1 hypothetical protein IMX26_13320 [Clostridium sp. 'deep sea']
MKKKHSFLIALIILAIVIVSVIKNTKKEQVLMNDVYYKNEIVKQLNTKKSVVIFGTTDIEDYRFVGYLIGNTVQSQRCSYAVFKKVDTDYYQINSVIYSKKMTSRAQDIVVSNFSFVKTGNTASTMFLIVLSKNANLAKITFEIKNEDNITIKKVYINPSITIFEYPQYDFTGEYLFYDKDGNIIR